MHTLYDCFTPFLLFILPKINNKKIPAMNDIEILLKRVQFVLHEIQITLETINGFEKIKKMVSLLQVIDLAKEILEDIEGEIYKNRDYQEFEKKSHLAACCEQIKEIELYSNLVIYHLGQKYVSMKNIIGLYGGKQVMKD